MLKKMTPLLWFLFSAGGTVAALLFPLHVLVTGLLIPLGWIDVPGYDSVVSLVSHTFARLYLFVLISLPLFPGAHRFRYTLCDGLKLKHLHVPIVLVCYGSAVTGTVAAAFFLWNFS